MIHAKYCYDSDPIDKWFEEDIEITDEMAWHLERFFDPERISFTDQMEWDYHAYWGGYRITLGGMLNQPVRAILNEPGLWVATGDSAFVPGSEVVVKVEGAEVYRTAAAAGALVLVDQAKAWMASRMGDGGTPVNMMQCGGNNDGTGAEVATVKEMTGLQGPVFDMATVVVLGGRPQGKTLVFEAALDPAVGPYQVGEIGLFTRDRMMIGREVIPGRLLKDAGKTFEITWTITF